MLTFKSNQPGLQLKEALVLGELINCEETYRMADDLKSKRSTNGCINNPIAS